MSKDYGYVPGDIITITFKAALVMAVNLDGSLSVQHSDQEMTHFIPDAIDVQVDHVGHDSEWNDPR